MKYIKIVIVLICLSSCDYFNKRKVYSEEILKEDLKTFNWNEVDQYPTFISCDNTASNDEKRVCFEQTLSQHIASYLGEQVIVVTQDVNDTVFITFQISDSGKLIMVSIDKSDYINTQIPELDTLMMNSLRGLPKIYPAIKRSQQVKTEFKLPIVISVN